MYLLVDQFLFALKSFKFSELSYCQNWDHKATQKKQTLTEVYTCNSTSSEQLYCESPQKH